MEKTTPEMREKLRAPLPSEAVSQHPTKSYLSSIKSIYVAERINDVFGIGAWTLKSDFVERVDKFVVVLARLEIPEYGFYGEAYGGNDNPDIGDAYKGAVTDGFTKIAAQQLEIGIDVFKGIHEATKQKVKEHLKETASKAAPLKAESHQEPKQESAINPPKTLQDFLSWVASHGKAYTPSWCCKQLNVKAPTEIADIEKAYLELKELSGWED